MIPRDITKYVIMPYVSFRYYYDQATTYLITKNLLGYYRIECDVQYGLPSSLNSFITCYIDLEIMYLDDKLYVHEFNRTNKVYPISKLTYGALVDVLVDVVNNSNPIIMNNISNKITKAHEHFNIIENKLKKY
jgi:hypothetical protein